MAVDSEQLVEEIVREFPDTWNYRDQFRFNRRWLNALCSGFQAMWEAGTMTPGIGPEPGPNPHSHTIVSLNPLLMSTPPKAVLSGVNGVTTIFADTVSLAVSQHLIEKTTTDIIDGTFLHIHQFLSVGNEDDLTDRIVLALQATGLFNVGASVLPTWFRAFSAALLEHLRQNASMEGAAGAGHIHILL